jgi:hypothetical protein
MIVDRGEAIRRADADGLFIVVENLDFPHTHQLR